MLDLKLLLFDEETNKYYCDNADLALSLLKKDWHYYEYLTDSLYCDDYFIYSVFYDKSLMANAPENFFLNIVENNKTNLYFLLKCFSKNEILTNYINDDLLMNREQLIEVFDSHVYLTDLILNRIMKLYNKDSEIIFKIISFKKEYLKYINDDLLNDRNFVLNLLKIRYVGYSNFFYYLDKYYSNLLEMIAINFSDDLEIMSLLTFGNSFYFKYIDNNLFKDKKLSIHFLKCNVPNDNLFDLIKIIVQFHYDDDLIVGLAIHKYPELINYASDRIKSSRKFILSRIKSVPKIIEFLSDDIRNDRAIIEVAVEGDGSLLKYAPEDLKNDREFVIKAIKSNPMALKYVSDELKKDRELVEIAIKINEDALKYADDSLQNDEKLNLIAKLYSSNRLNELFESNIEEALEIIKINNNHLYKIPKNLTNDIYFMKKLVEINGLYLQYGSNLVRLNPEIVEAAVTNNGLAIKYSLVDDESYTNIYDYFPNIKALNSIRLNNAVIAVNNNPLAINFVSENICSNPVFINKVKISIANVVEKQGFYCFDRSLSKLKKEKEIKTAISKFELFNNPENTLVEKLKKYYYKSYKEKVVSKYPDRDNDISFYKTIINSNVLDEICKSNEYTVHDHKLIRETAVDIFDNPNNAQSFLNKLTQREEYYRMFYIKVFNDFQSCVNKDKEKLYDLLEKCNLNENNINSFILLNKYYDADIKKRFIEIINILFDKEKIMTVYDIFEILEEMTIRNLTIDQILYEKEIDKSTFDQIYKNAKENNPILFYYIKDSLELNKIRGFKKFIRKGYLVLKMNFDSIEQFEEKIKTNIYKFINEYKSTELYDKILNKLCLLDGFDYDCLSNSQSEGVILK